MRTQPLTAHSNHITPQQKLHQLVVTGNNTACCRQATCHYTHACMTFVCQTRPGYPELNDAKVNAVAMVMIRWWSVLDEDERRGWSGDDQMVLLWCPAEGETRWWLSSSMMIHMSRWWVGRDESSVTTLSRVEPSPALGARCHRGWASPNTSKQHWKE